MDVKVIVKQMRDSGMSNDEIIANLNDLGVANPQQYLNDTPAQEPITSTTTSTPDAPSFETIGGGRKPITKTNTQQEENPANLFENPAAKPKPAQTNQDEPTPNFQFTKIDGDEEKTVDLEKMLGKEDPSEGAQVMRTVAKSNINSDEIESKLDETVALLKSLQEINKKILDTNRDILMRLKK